MYLHFFSNHLSRRLYLRAKFGAKPLASRGSHVHVLEYFTRAIGYKRCRALPGTQEGAVRADSDLFVEEHTFNFWHRMEHRDEDEAGTGFFLLASTMQGTALTPATNPRALFPLVLASDLPMVQLQRRLEAIRAGLPPSSEGRP